MRTGSAQEQETVSAHCYHCLAGNLAPCNTKTILGQILTPLTPFGQTERTGSFCDPVDPVAGQRHTWSESDPVDPVAGLRHTGSESDPVDPVAGQRHTGSESDPVDPVWTDRQTWAPGKKIFPVQTDRLGLRGKKISPYRQTDLGSGEKNFPGQTDRHTDRKHTGSESDPVDPGPDFCQDGTDSVSLHAVVPFADLDNIIDLALGCLVGPFSTSLKAKNRQALKAIMTGMFPKRLLEQPQTNVAVPAEGSGDGKGAVVARTPVAVGPASA